MPRSRGPWPEDCAPPVRQPYSAARCGAAPARPAERDVTAPPRRLRATPAAGPLRREAVSVMARILRLIDSLSRFPPRFPPLGPRRKTPWPTRPSNHVSSNAGRSPSAQSRSACLSVTVARHSRRSDARIPRVRAENPLLADAIAQGVGPVGNLPSSDRGDRRDRWPRVRPRRQVWAGCPGLPAHVARAVRREPAPAHHRESQAGAGL